MFVVRMMVSYHTVTSVVGCAELWNALMQHIGNIVDTRVISLAEAASVFTMTLIHWADDSERSRIERKVCTQYHQDGETIYMSPSCTRTCTYIHLPAHIPMALQPYADVARYE